MKWQLVNILAMIAVPVVPSLAVYFGYLSEHDNQTASGLLASLMAVAFFARIFADRETGQTSFPWLILTAAFSVFFGYYFFTF
jgi:hypothetical protein